MLVARDEERQAIERLLEAARAGVGGGLLLRGDPGMGKSVLLANACDEASDMRVLRATCVEAETPLAYAVLHQLVRPVLDSLDRLPPPQRQALATALGLELGTAPDRFLISLACLTLLSEVASQQPVLCAIDDVQWCDEPSLEMIRFFVRRLETEAIAVLASARSGEARDLQSAGMHTLDLQSLTSAESGAVIDAHWGEDLAAPVRESLIAAAHGNPLALIELPRGLSVEQRVGSVPLPDPLPLPDALGAVYSPAIERLDPDARTVALLCALAGRAQLATITAAAVRLGVQTPVLELPDLEPLIRVAHQLVDFSHPLLRSAVFHMAPPTARRAAHLALASSEDDADRRAWHRSEAALGPDEVIASELELVADQTLQRSGYAAAADALERAAELSLSTTDSVRRLIASAEAAWHAGHSARACALVQRAERGGLDDPAVALRARYVQGSVELRSGVPADGLHILLDAVHEYGAANPPLAVRVLAVAGEASFQAGEGSGRISRLLAALPDSDDLGQILMVLGYRAIQAGATPDDFAALRQKLGGADHLDDLDVLIRVAGLAFGVGEYVIARRLWSRTASRARALGAAGALAAALRPLALDETARARYAWAEASAAEGRALALETDQLNLAWQYAALLAELAGIRGRETEARALADEVLREATTRGLHGTVALMRRALGQLCLALGRPEEAIGHLEALWTLHRSSHRAIALGVIPDLVEAGVRAGHPELATAWLERLLEIDAGTFAEARAVVMRSRALVSAGAEADSEFQQALHAHAASDRPLEQARTALLYGEYLRRERRRAEAREPLRAALETFDRVGATLWAERARTELRATGETARKREPSTFDQLTRQELQVLRAVAQGITNREAAAQLFISPRTVDHHLRSIFLKLGIASRAELIRLALANAPN
jgi:DNA-binding CsgD family transcriptional regulator